MVPGGKIAAYPQQLLPGRTGLTADGATNFLDAAVSRDA
jgi:hypothetical protein